MPTEIESELLTGIREWVEIESQTADAEGVNALVSRVAAAFAETGARLERIPGRDGFGDHLSITAPWGGDGPGILVLCHLDTVHPRGTLAQLPFRIDGDRAYGPGIYDMKGCVYIAYQAYRTIAEAGRATPLPIRFLCTSDEEVGSPTSRRLIERAAADAKYVLVTEPARSGGKVVTGRKGVGRYVVTARGRAAHSGVGHKEGRSAIREIARQVLDLEALTDYDRGMTLNVGQIKGGTADNVVPEFCQAYVDVRMVSENDAKAIDRHIRDLKSHNPDIELTIDGEINRPPYRKTPEIDALFRHAKALAAEIGFELEDMFTGGGSDGSFVATRVPTLDGIGVDGSGAHTLDEHIYISSLVPRMTLLKRLFETLE